MKIGLKKKDRKETGCQPQSTGKTSTPDKIQNPLPQRQTGTAPKAPPPEADRHCSQSSSPQAQGTPPKDCSKSLTLRSHNKTSTTQKGVDSEIKGF